MVLSVQLKKYVHSACKTENARLKKCMNPYIFEILYARRRYYVGTYI